MVVGSLERNSETEQILLLSMPNFFPVPKELSNQPGGRCWGKNTVLTTIMSDYYLTGNRGMTVLQILGYQPLTRLETKLGLYSCVWLPSNPRQLLKKRKSSTFGYEEPCSRLRPGQFHDSKSHKKCSRCLERHYTGVLHPGNLFSYGSCITLPHQWSLSLYLDTICP